MGCAPTPWTCTASHPSAQQQQQQQQDGAEIQINISSPSPQALSPAATGDAADWKQFHQAQEKGSQPRAPPSEPVVNGNGNGDVDADEKKVAAVGHRDGNNGANEEDVEKAHHPFHDLMHKAHVARIHDSLKFGSGLTRGQVLSWKMVSVPIQFPYIPFPFPPQINH